MRSTQLLAAVVALSSLSAAWPWPENMPQLMGLSAADWIPAKRQDGGNNNNNNNNNNGGGNNNNGNDDATPKPTPTTGTAKTTDPPKGTETGKNDDPEATTGPKGPTTTARSDLTKGPTGTKTFGITVSPGGIELLTPALISGAQYYKIRDYVTFGWNYTSLKVTPSRIDVLASCTENQVMYTIASNQTAGKSGLAVWDSHKDATGTAPLVMASYTLIIKDADVGISAIPQPGYMAVFNQFQFAMYEPRDPTPLSEWNCPTCSNFGVSTIERQTLAVLLGTATMTVLSFTWFASGFFGVL